MSLKLDIDVARAMGFRVVRDRDNVRGFQIGGYGRKGHDLPCYSEDASLIPVLLTWIKDHDLWYEYIAALIGSNEPTLIDVAQAWELLCATPEQHCRALIASTQSS